jgi:hypothetical protein
VMQRLVVRPSLRAVRPLAAAVVVAIIVVGGGGAHRLVCTAIVRLGLRVWAQGVQLLLQGIPCTASGRRRVLTAGKWELEICYCMTV